MCVLRIERKLRKEIRDVEFHQKGKWSSNHKCIKFFDSKFDTNGVVISNLAINTATGP